MNKKLQIDWDQVNIACFKNDQYYELKIYLTKLIHDLNLKDLFELMKPFIKSDQCRETLDSHSRSSSQDSTNSSLSKIDDDINEALDKLITSNPSDMDVANNETFILLCDIVNDYTELSKVYSIEADKYKWIAGLFYIRYEKNARFHKMNEMLKLTNQIASSIVASSSQDEVNNKYTKKSCSTSFKKHQSQPFPTLNENNQSNKKNRYQKTINLNKLLVLTDQNLSSFIQIIQNLTKMLNIPCELVERVDIIEKNFNVSCILFNKYKQIYQYFFIVDLYQDKHTDFKLELLFKFGWLLFIYIKENYIEIGHDLVNSFYLLICCINLIYDSIDPKFIRLDLPQDTSFIEYICKLNDMDQLEVKTLNRHHFNKILTKYQITEWFVKDDENGNIFYKNLAEYSMVLEKNYESILNALYELNNLIKIDERVFLYDDSYTNNNSLSNLNNTENKLELPECLKYLPLFHISACDELKENLMKNKLFLNINNLSQEQFKYLYESVLRNYSSLIKESLIREIKLSENENWIDYIIVSSSSFYLYVLENVIENEKKKAQNDNNNEINNDLFMKIVDVLIKNESFNKSIFSMCFELIINFSKTNLTKSQTESTSFLLETNPNLKFPWCLNQIKIDSFEFFMFIELFVRSISLLNNNQPSTQEKTPNTRLTCYLDKNMIKHLNRIEELILEQFAWSIDSNIWKELETIQLNRNQKSFLDKTTQLDEAFPLNQDLYFDDSNSANSTTKTTSNQDSVLNFTPAKTITTSLANSPAKYPTITKVICSSDNIISNSMQKVLSSNNLQSNINNLSTIKQILKKKDSILSNKQRIINLNYRLIYFFRKFYNLANCRLREMIDKLELVTKLPDSNTLIHPSAINTPNLMSSSNPVITPIQSHQTPILTPISSNLQNENVQFILKNIWNIFEYSISKDNGIKLLMNRHLDQLLMCSIYITCRCMLIKIQFHDIMKIYRLTWPKTLNKNHVYRNVYINNSTCEPRDLIYFYNEIYIKHVKQYAVNLITKLSVSCPSPIPKNNQIITNQFSPRKIMASSNQYSIFVSPIKHQISTIQTLPTPNGSSQLMPPLTNRNKLKFNFNEQNPSKSLELINEMIKKNELKIKTSNKRLFSDISIHNTIPFNNIKTSSINNNFMTPNELDESDNKIKKLHTIKTPINTNSPTQNVFLNKMIGFTKSPNLTLTTRSATSPNLITMVVSNTNPTASSATIGSNFARKLQDIQSERNFSK